MAEPRKLALIKGSDRFLFCFDDSGKGQVLETIGRFASDQSLDFDWLDAAILGQQIEGTSAWRLGASV